MKSKILAAAMMWGLAASGANAATYNFTTGEYDGDGNIGAALIATWNVILGAGEHIVSATFSSTWGNSSVPNSAEGFVTVGGNTVGACTPAEACYNAQSPTPFSYAFSASEFASLLGNVDLFYTQTGCCIIRLGESTLKIETASVPVPAAGALLLPALGGLVAFGKRRRKQKIA